MKNELNNEKTACVDKLVDEINDYLDNTEFRQHNNELAEQRKTGVIVPDKQDIYAIAEFIADENAFGKSEHRQLDDAVKKTALIESEAMHFARLDNGGVPAAYEHLRNFVLSKILRRDVNSIDDLAELNTNNSQCLLNLIEKQIIASQGFMQKLSENISGRNTERTIAAMELKKTYADYVTAEREYEETVRKLKRMPDNGSMERLELEKRRNELELSKGITQIHGVRNYVGYKLSDREAEFLRQMFYSLRDSTTLFAAGKEMAQYAIRLAPIVFQLYKTQIEQGRMSKTADKQLRVMNALLGNLYRKVPEAIKQHYNLIRNPLLRRFYEETPQDIEPAVDSITHNGLDKNPRLDVFEAMIDPSILMLDGGSNGNGRYKTR